MFNFKSQGQYTDLSHELQSEEDWSVGTLRQLDYPAVVTAVAFEPVLGLLAIGSTSHIHIFGKAAVHSILALPEEVAVKFLQFSSLTFQLIAVDENQILHTWDLSTFGKPKYVAHASFNQPINFITLSPLHGHAFIALQSGEVRTYDLLCHRKSDYTIPNMWQLYQQKVTHTPAEISPVVEVVIHPRDLNLLFVAYAGGVILSDLTQRNTVRAFELVIPAGAPGAGGYGSKDLLTHRHPEVTAIAVHPAGHFFAAGYDDGSIALWALEDEDQPVVVKTLEELDINTVDAEKLEQHLPTDQGPAHDLPIIQREPIFKLAWSGFPNSSDPRGGETVLSILGGALLGEPSGLTVQWLPPFNPAEPPANPQQTGLPPSIRAAMRESFVPQKSYFYYTAGQLQDFTLLPRDSPHFSNSFDPTAVLLLSDSTSGTRSLDAYEFPPPAFKQSLPEPAEPEPAETEESTEESSGNLMDDLLASTLESLVVDQDPHRLRLPELLSVGSSGVNDVSLIALSRDSYEALATDEADDKYTLGLKGGLAWSDESYSNILKLSKYQPHRLLITHHADLSIRFQDISAQLLIYLPPDPIAKDFPDRLPNLDIDLMVLLTDPAIFRRTPATFVSDARISSVELTSESLECVVVLRSGELIVFQTNSPRQDERQDPANPEIIILQHVSQPSGRRFQPYFMLAAGNGPVTATGLSDVGFLAVSYADGTLLAIDMRIPGIILRQSPDPNAGGSFHRKSQVDVYTSLMWTINSLHGAQHRIQLVAIRASGDCDIFVITRTGSAWTIEPKAISADAAVNPIFQCLVDARTGVQWKADRSRLKLAILPADPEEAETRHAFWITAGSKGIRCTLDITGDKISKADWGSKNGAVQSVHLIERNESHALIAITAQRQVLVYSLPQLELLSKLSLPDAYSGITVDNTGDFISYLRHPASGIIETAKYSTLFNIRRTYALPDIELGKGPPVIPAQPQPVSLGPTSILSSWFRFGGSMTGESIDVLLGGPDRPIPVKTAAGKGGPNNAAAVAAQAADAQAGVYDKLSNALQERGQMLGDLEERFNSLEDGSRGMVAQAKRLAAQQTAKGWFGF